MIKLTLVISINERKTPNTIYRYRFNTLGLRYEKSNVLVLFKLEEELFRDEVELIDETLIES